MGAAAALTRRRRRCGVAPNTGATRRRTVQDPAPRLSRRALLASAAAFAALPALPYAAPARAAPAGIHIVDGWVLTTADLQALGLDAR